MKTKAIKQYKTPRYPDQYQPDLTRLLTENRPLHWKAGSAAGVALTAAVMLGLSSCAVTDGTPTPPPLTTVVTGGTTTAAQTAATTGETTATTQTDATTTTGAATTATTRAVVTTSETTPSTQYAVTPGVPAPPPLPAAPLFDQGGGIGVYGCVSVAAPVFLSEDDAFAILSDEFKKQGLTVEKSNTRLEKFPLPVTIREPGGGGEKPFATKKGTLEIDFRVVGKPVEMEFVSKQDYDAWSKGDPDSSVESNDFKRAAQTLVKGFDAQESRQTRAAFYDPAETAPTQDRRPADQAESQRLSEEALRRQAQDFLRWLAANEII